MALKATKSYLAKTGEVPPRWLLVDATDQVLGRLATRLATVLMGKHRPTYTPHVLTGDAVIVINAERIKLTGRKREQKEYDRYTQHAGGRKVTPMAVMMDKHPDRVIELAVRRMLPKNRLARRMLSRLHVYRGSDHPHQAQQPEPTTL